MANKDYCVYKHTSPNGKVYIGVTCQNPLNRWKNGHGYSNNPHFYNAILKYGWDNITHEILFTDLTKEEAERKEIELIQKNQSNRFDFGYNRDNGGFYNGRVSKSTKKKISEARKGMTFSKEHCEHIRQSKMGERNPNYGKKRSEEWCDMMSSVHKGKVVSEDTKRKLSECNTGGKHPQARIVICVETGVVFDCVKNAANFYNLDSSAIIKVCRGKLKQTGGFHWKYDTQEEAEI